MKADRIFKNAKIFTSDKDKPMASSLVVKDIQDSPVLGTMVGGEWVYTGK